MRQGEYNQVRVRKYLIWTFGVAWIMQIVVAFLCNNQKAATGQILMAVMMFVPLTGVLFSGNKLSGAGWKPEFRKNIKWFLITWFLPAILTFIGAVLYFLVFPSHFDLSGQYLIAAAGKQTLDKITAQGISYPIYILIGCLGSLTYAPVINTIAALGEEVGWRGFLYPQLKAKYGRLKGRILGGIIWGAWHWPLIWLIGYEYGPEYIGFPAVGMMLFCVITIGIGLICDWLYERSGTIWMPSLFHGAFNAAGTIPMTMCIINTHSARLLGPAPVGLIAGLPIIVIAIMLSLRDNQE